MDGKVLGGTHVISFSFLLFSCASQREKTPKSITFLLDGKVLDGTHGNFFFFFLLFSFASQRENSQICHFSFHLFFFFIFSVKTNEALTIDIYIYIGFGSFKMISAL